MVRRLTGSGVDLFGIDHSMEQGSRSSSSTSMRKRDTVQDLAIYGQAHLTKAMRQRGIRPERAVYYGANVSAGPPSPRHPGLPSCIDSAMRARSGWILCPSVRTAFLAIATVGLETE